MKYKAVIFDLDNTLVNTNEVIEDTRAIFHDKISQYFPHISKNKLDSAHNEAYRIVFKSNKQRELPVHTAYIKIWYIFCELLSVPPKISLVYQFIQTFTQQLGKKLILLPGVKKTLKVLHQNDIPIHILTNGPFYHQAHKIHALQIEKYISYLITPDICLADKPDQKAFYFMLKSIKKNPHEVLMVGDDYVADIFGAYNSNIDTAWIKNNHCIIDNKYVLKPTYTIKQIDEIIPIVLNNI